MPRYGAYDKNDNHTYAIGVFPSMELLAARPESVRCLLVSPAGYQNAGVNKLIEACRGMNVPVEEAPRAVERISGKENSWVVTVLNKYACSLDPAANHVVLHNPSDVGQCRNHPAQCAGLRLQKCCDHPSRRRSFRSARDPCVDGCGVPPEYRSLQYL